jgi:alpha-1,2-mannosyltransferase
LKHGFHDYGISALTAAWLVPRLTRSIAGLADIPFGLIVMLMFYLVTLRRTLLNRQDIAAGVYHIAQA